MDGRLWWVTQLVMAVRVLVRTGGRLSQHRTAVDVDQRKHDDDHDEHSSTTDTMSSSAARHRAGHCR